MHRGTIFVRDEAWVDQVYHRSEHGGLDTTPLLRWQQDIESVRQLPPARDLGRLFFYRLNRLVRRDSTFELRGQFYEAPPSLEGETVEVRFDSLDPSQVEIYFQGQAQGLARPVDAVVNAQLASFKSVPAPASEPTGINLVELLRTKKKVNQSMWETFVGFKKIPLPDCPDPKQLFTFQAWNQVSDEVSSRLRCI